MIARALRAFGLGVATVLASAALASLVLTLIVVAPGWPSGGWTADGLGLDVFLAASFVSVPFTTLGLVLFGLPADYVLRAVECRNPLAYGACGLGGGLLLVAVISKGEALSFSPLGWAGMGYGLVTSLVFWALFRRWRRAGESLAEERG